MERERPRELSYVTEGLPLWTDQLDVVRRPRHGTGPRLPPWLKVDLSSGVA